MNWGRIRWFLVDGFERADSLELHAQDTERTLWKIIRYKSACVSNQHDDFRSPSEPLKTDVNKNVLIERVPN